MMMMMMMMMINNVIFKLKLEIFNEKELRSCRYKLIIKFNLREQCITK